MAVLQDVLQDASWKRDLEEDNRECGLRRSGLFSLRSFGFGLGLGVTG